MIRIEVGPDDVAASRFAVSPTFELAHLIRSLFRAAPEAPVARRFRTGVAAIRDDAAVQAFAYLQGPGYGASFSAPPPEGMGQTLQDDLATILGTDPAIVRAEVAEVRVLRRPNAAVAEVLDSDRFIERLVDAIAQSWEAVLAADWPRVRAVLERDVRFRAERLTEVGWSAALSGMHPQLVWERGGITVDRPQDGTSVPTGKGLLLVPSVFIGQSLAIYNEAPWQPTIVYPSRGAGLLFEEADPPTDPLAPLLGRTRAGLLLALATPSSTTQLAALTGATIGATGDHLRVLLDAGLVARARIARSVVYRRTALGDALATAS